MVIILLVIGTTYFISFCMMRCASRTDREYEILARRKFYEERLTDCSDANANLEDGTE